MVTQDALPWVTDRRQPRGRRTGSTWSGCAGQATRARGRSGALKNVATRNCCSAPSVPSSTQSADALENAQLVTHRRSALFSGVRTLEQTRHDAAEVGSGGSTHSSRSRRRRDISVATTPASTRPTPDAELVAVVDRDLSRARRGDRRTNTAVSALDEPAESRSVAVTAAASVAVPTENHREVAVEPLLRRRVSMCWSRNRSPRTDRRGGLDRRHRRRSHGRLAMVGHTERYNPAVHGVDVARSISPAILRDPPAGRVLARAAPTSTSCSI